MGGQSKYNAMAERQRVAAEKQRNEILEKALEPTASERRYEQQSQAWFDWVEGRDYRNPPPSEVLDFGLFDQSRINEQMARYDNLQGTGATNIAGQGGDSSIALKLAKHRQSAQMAQQGAANYESAVAATNAGYKGAGFQWAGLQNAHMGNLLGMQQQHAQSWGQREFETRTRSPWLAIAQIGASVAGAALAPG